MSVKADADFQKHIRYTETNCLHLVEEALKLEKK